MFEFDEHANIANTLWAHTADGKMTTFVKDTLRRTSYTKRWPRRILLQIAARLF
jgi:hypothetical protein